MAKSKARKIREHKQRNGEYKVENSRAIRPDFSTHTRKTESRQGKLNKRWSKHKGQRYKGVVL